MAHEPMRHLFFRCKFAACITNTFIFIDMKKILLLIAMTGVLMGAISCSDDDEPQRGDGVFTVNTAMVNHMVQTGSDAVIGISVDIILAGLLILLEVKTMKKYKEIKQA